MTENILTANPDLKGIFAANEASDVGAVEALRISNKFGKVKVVGWDTSPDELEGVTDGRRLRARHAGPVQDGRGRRRRGGGPIRDHKQLKDEDTGVALVTKQEPAAEAGAADGRPDLRR